jgi:hypothetical protein
MMSENDSTDTMNWEERLDALRRVLGEECNRCTARDHEFAADDVASWLINKKRKLVVNGLVGLIGQAQDRYNDEDRAQRILRRRPDLAEAELAKVMRQVSRTLGVGYWYLLTLAEADDHQKLRQCFGAAQLIHELRAAEAHAEAEAMQALEEMIEPVTKNHPEMPLGEAMREIERRTGETIRGLEGEHGDNRQ